MIVDVLEALAMKKEAAPMTRRFAYIEWHAKGPRVHVLGCRIHEFHLGFGFLAVAVGTAAVPAAPLWIPSGVQAACGIWLIVKDWPDLFPSTRDTACWSMGIHRPPAPPWRAAPSPDRPGVVPEPDAPLEAKEAPADRASVASAMILLDV